MSTTDPPPPDRIARTGEEEILEALAAVIGRITDIPARDVGRATSFADDLHLLPIGMFTLAAASEVCFGVKVPKEHIDTLKTTGDLIDYILDHQP